LKLVEKQPYLTSTKNFVLHKLKKLSLTSVKNILLNISLSNINYK